LTTIFDRPFPRTADLTKIDHDQIYIHHNDFFIRDVSGQNNSNKFGVWFHLNCKYATPKLRIC
jgi:hypothetical protein